MILRYCTSLEGEVRAGRVRDDSVCVLSPEMCDEASQAGFAATVIAPAR